MELRRYVAMVRKRLLLVVVTVLVSLAIAGVATPRVSSYIAHSTIVVGPRQYSTAGGSTSVSGDQFIGVEVLLNTYSELIPTVPIADLALQATHVARSAATVVGETRAAAVANTQLLTITITDPDPVVAKTLATGMADAFVNEVNSLKSDTSATVGTLPEIPVYVFEEAQLPTVPQSTGLRSNLIVAGIFGLLAAGLVVGLLEYLDVSIRDAEDAERRLGLPVLGTVPLLASVGPVTTGAVGTPSARPAGVSRRSG